MKQTESYLLTTCLLAASLALTIGGALHGQDAADNSERQPVIATSGTNEIAAIEVNRWQAFPCRMLERET